MKNLPNASRFLALLTVGVLSAGVLLQSAPAHAADKAKNYKYGAIALGAVGAYLLSKGKTVEGAAVLGAGAYTYKKGEDTRKADKYDDYRDRYSYRDRNNNRYPNPVPTRDRYDNYGNYGNYNDYNDRYRVPARNRLSDNNSSYRNDNYRDRNNDRDRYRDNDRRGNKGDRYEREHPKLRAR